MREFIKKYPWRLEIVSFAVVVFAFVFPLVMRQEMLTRMHPWHGYNVEQVWLLRYMLRGLMVIALWIGKLVSYWELTSIKHEEDLNWWNLSIYTAGIAIAGWFMSGWMFNTLWIAVTIIAFVLEGLTVKSHRPEFHALSEEQVQAIDVKPGETFYYSEQKSLYQHAVIQMFLGFLVLPGVWSASGEWSVIVMLIIFPLIFTFSRNTFSVSNERVTAKIAYRKTKIPISSISNYSVYDFDPYVGRHKGMITIYDGMRLLAPKLGPCLKIETIDGKAYLLGVKDPESFCKLIEIAAQSKRAEED